MRVFPRKTLYLLKICDMKFEEYKELLRRDRTCRIFDESQPVGRETLASLVELTRYCASGRNAQPLRYRAVTEAGERAALFGTLAWAGYYTDWDGPQPGQRPAAYLVQCLDTRFGADCLCDDGLQLQAMTLGATLLGLGGCIIKSFDAVKAAEILHIPEHLAPRYVLALGVPAETVVIEDMDGSPDASFRYFRDETGAHHVPKRPLGEILL